MKLKVFISLFLLLMLVTNTSCDKTEEHSPDEVINIPDEVFLETLIEKDIDSNGDGRICYSEAEFVYTLSVSGMEITSLVGIEGFVNLVKLSCRYNLLTSLDLSENKQLEELDCHHNQLNLLILPSNSGLRKLNCSWNELTELDLSKNVGLEELISGINLFESLDLSKNKELNFFTCSYSKLEQLDLSSNPLITFIQCGGNPMKKLNISDNDLIESLDISDMPSLEEVCVWILPFPPEGVSVNMDGSPNVYFTTDCH